MNKRTMKRMILAAALMIAASGARAQSNVGSWSIQPKAGLNIATMTDSDGADPRFGLDAGAEAEYQVSERVSLSTGLLYSQQGIKDSPEGVSETIKMDYLNVPLLANVYVAKGLALKAGIQPGFLLNDKVELKSNGAKVEVGLEESFRAAGLKADVKSFVLSIPVGVSYEFSSVVLDARYNLGISKAASAEGESTKHNVFQFTVGYKFSL